MRYSTLSHYPNTRHLAALLLLMTCLVTYAYADAYADEDAKYKQSVAEFAADKSADAELLRAIHRDDLDAVIRELGKGGNPNKIYGQREYMWSMCLATDSDREQILELLLAHGGDPNLVNPNKKSLFSSPITCAVGFGNALATKTLLSSGANPARNTCANCPYHESPLAVAVSSMSLGSAILILQATQPVESDISVIKRLVEKQTQNFDADHKVAILIAEFAKFLDEAGIEYEIEYRWNTQ
ncbi:MAG: hypothetical protein V3U76_12840 [Granulosicoccus sp.]